MPDGLRPDFFGGGITVFAEETPQLSAGEAPAVENEQEISSKWQGKGTQENPYLIQSVDDLTSLAASVNGEESTGTIHSDGQYENIYFKLTKNLDLSGISNWTPIGVSGDACFSGNFDGDGHTISNLKSSGRETAGLFGYVAYGSVSNLTVEKANISAVSSGVWNPALAGTVMAAAYESKITNCEARDSEVTASREGNTSFAGGFVGGITGSSFNKCASVNNTITANSYEGGFAASLDEEDSTFTSCYVANCNITATDNDFTRAGFFIGESQGGKGTIKNSFIYGGQIIVADGHTGEISKGIFINPSQYGDLTLNNDYYSVDESTDDFTDKNSDGMMAKTKEELNREVSAISDDFIQGKDHPILKSAPADYSEVDKAIAQASSLNKNDYKDFSAVTSAVSSVVRGKTVADQNAVDAMAKAITDAIEGLEKKPSTPVIVPPSTTPSINTPSNGNNTVSPEYPASDSQGKIQFSDVPNIGDLKSAVSFGVRKGYINGTSNTTFNPNAEVTRAQFVAFLYRLNGSKRVDSTSEFTDARKDSNLGGKDFYDAINWGVANGIVKGYGDGSFQPFKTVSRAEAVAFLHRYFKGTAKTKASFVDVSETAYYADDVSWAYESKVTFGTDATHFAPNAPTTRGQAVQFIYRASK